MIFGQARPLVRVMTRTTPILMAALLALAAAACDREPDPPLASGPTPPLAASRVWVLGGDSLIVDGQHIRLANAYAPQTIPDARCWSEALAAKFAIQQVKTMIASTRTIQVEPTGERDQYNRAVSIVRLDGLDLGDQLFHLGLAGQPGRGRFDWCKPLSVETKGAPSWTAFGENGRP